MKYYDLKVSSENLVWNRTGQRWGSHSGRLSEENAELKRSRTLPSGVLPPMLRRVNYSPFGTTVIMERPPTLETITYCGTNKSMSYEDNAEKQVFTIPLPWTLYIGSIVEGKLNSLNLFALPFSTDRLSKRDLDADLFLLPLPNYYSDGTFCLSQDAREEQIDSIASAMDLMYTSVWGAEFNLDTNDVIREFYSAEYNSAGEEAHRVVSRNMNDRRRASSAGIFHEWSKRSLEDIISRKSRFLWMQTDLTAREILESSGGDGVVSFASLVTEQAARNAFTESQRLGVITVGS